MTLSLNDWAVLALVVEEPRHGFAIARELRRDAPVGYVWRVARPQVYRSLNRLVDDGLAEWGPTEPGHGPERRVVSPTAAGRAAVEDWATTPVGRLRQVRSELLLKLVVARRLGLDVAGLVTAQTEVIAKIRARIEHELASADPDRRIALHWRYEAAEAVTRFLASVSA